MSHIHSIQVYFGDTDGAGIAYYPNFYRWMDQATHEFFKAKGIALTKLKDQDNIIVPLAEAKCNFKKPLFHDDEVDVRTEVIEIKNKVLKVEHRFIRDQVEVANGYEVRIWTSAAEERMKAVPVPDEVKSMLQNE